MQQTDVVWQNRVFEHNYDVLFRILPAVLVWGNGAGHSTVVLDQWGFHLFA